MRNLAANEFSFVSGGAPAGESELNTVAQGLAIGALANALVGDEPGAVTLAAAAGGIKIGEYIYSLI